MGCEMVCELFICLGGDAERGRGEDVCVLWGAEGRVPGLLRGW